MKEIRRIVLTSLVLLAGLAGVFGLLIGAAGCALSGPTAPETLNATDLAAVASALSDYQAKALEGEKAALEAEDVDGDDSPSLSVRFNVIGVDPNPDYVLADGTEVYVQKSDDDNGTLDNVEDDMKIIERRFYADREDVGDEEVTADDLLYIETIERPRKPAADWSVWENQEVLNDDGTFTQTGSVEYALTEGGDPFRNGEIAVTWEKVNGAVELIKIVRTFIRANGTISTITITFDDDGNAMKNEVRIRVVHGEELVVKSFTYVQYTDPDDGIEKTKIISEDNSYALRWYDDAWLTEWYDAEDLLLRRRIETGARNNRSVTVEIYDENGQIVETRAFSVRFIPQTDGTVLVRKTFSDGSTRNVIIDDTEDGYTVTINGDSYTAAIDLTTGTIAVYDSDGSLIGTVTVNADGSYEVDTGSETETVVLE